MKQVLVLLLGWAALFWAEPARAQPSPNPNPSQSTVRFRISYGANFFGDIDVQLFDRDKPLTVSNFLYYARNDGYPNTLLHRCVPGVLLQGGEWIVASPASPTLFQSLLRVPTNDAIRNEFQTGSARSNVFGALAMWKPPGATNAANSQWFFNLGDNHDGTGTTNFDAAAGGYTVFGQVTAGTNVLEFFNSLSENQGLLNMTNAFYQGFCSPVQLLPDGVLAFPFEALPVSFTNGFTCPFYRDLFTVQILILSGPDSSPPQLTVTSPAANSVVTNQDVVLTGTASDNQGVSSVRIYWEGNSPFLATLTTNRAWTATLTNVPPGTNSFLVEVMDTSGLRAQILRSFFRSVRAPLTLQVAGAGAGIVSGPTNQQMLEIGRGYLLVARPAAGNLFGGWDGSFPQPGAKLNFLMGSNTTLTAVFATNLFPFVKGTYQGLFFDPVLVEPQSAGYLTLTVNSLGAYTAKVLMNGKSYPVRGSFHPDGRGTNLVLRSGTNALLLRTVLDLSGASEQLTGVLTNNQVANIDLAFPWSAVLQADRSSFDPRTNANPSAGSYTLVLPADTNVSAGPDGDSVGTATVNTRGAVTFTAKLADHTRLTQKTYLSRDQQWPLYAVPAGEKGAVLGWLQFDSNQPSTDVGGLLNWFKPTRSTAKFYPEGFTNELTAVGSRYVRPVPPARVLALTNAVVTFVGGDVQPAVANHVVLNENNQVINQDTNRLKLTIAKPNGAFSGTVVPPASTRSHSFNGVVLQKQNRGAGYFLGTNLTGRVSLESSP